MKECLGKIKKICFYSTSLLDYNLHVIIGILVESGCHCILHLDATLNATSACAILTFRKVQRQGLPISIQNYPDNYEKLTENKLLTIITDTYPYLAHAFKHSNST